jgi:hypothetical protein
VTNPLLTFWAEDLVRRVADGRALPAEVELVAEAVIEELVLRGQEAELIEIGRRAAMS